MVNAFTASTASMAVPLTSQDYFGFNIAPSRYTPIQWLVKRRGGSGETRGMWQDAQPEDLHSGERRRWQEAQRES